jgi:tRNA pseudouridine38-40 synthase
MARFRLTVEYHGGPFVGWQRQAVGRSVQGELEAALARLGEDGATVTGAGRTDAGVHALGQVAHCDLTRDWAPERLAAALNHHLRPHPIAVLSAALVDEAFHARFSAVERRYVYRVADRAAPLTVDHGLAWRVPGPLDVDAMTRAAAPITGRHDFTTFRAAACQAASPVKTLDMLAVRREAPCMVTIEARARSFLHNQVRSLVGTLVKIGAGRWPPERMAEALAARDRAACGPVAPPDGLYLTHVGYEGGD